MSILDFSGKTVLITGASKGIGAAAARAFVAAGGQVALMARTAASLEELATELGQKALAITGDVSKPDEVEAAVEQTVEQFGRLDVYVANAGVVGPMAPLVATSAADWDRTIDINLKGVSYGMRAAFKQMLRQGSGTFITVSSGAAHNAVPGWSAYCASKAGAYMLTRMAHTEVGGKGIRVLGLSPGTVATDMQRAIKDSGVGPVAQLEWSAHIPPEWAAKALLWMCGPESDGYLGTDVPLREEAIRRKVGLI